MTRSEERNPEDQRLASSSIPAGQEAAFDAYYKTYALPRWTMRRFWRDSPKASVRSTSAANCARFLHGPRRA